MLRLPPSTITLNMSEVKSLIERRSKHRRQFLRYLHQQERAPRETTEVIHAVSPLPGPQEQLRVVSANTGPSLEDRVVFDALLQQLTLPDRTRRDCPQEQTEDGLPPDLFDQESHSPGRQPSTWRQPSTPPQRSPEMRLRNRRIGSLSSESSDASSGIGPPNDGPSRPHHSSNAGASSATPRPERSLSNHWRSLVSARSLDSDLGAGIDGRAMPTHLRRARERQQILDTDRAHHQTTLPDGRDEATLDSVDGADERPDISVRPLTPRGRIPPSVRRRLHPDERGDQIPSTPSRRGTPTSFQVYDDALPPSIQPRTPQHLPEARHQSRLRGSYTAPPVRSSPLPIQTPTARQRREMREMRGGTRTRSPPGVQTPGMMGLYGGFENTDDEILFEEARRHRPVRPRTPN